MSKIRKVYFHYKVIHEAFLFAVLIITLIVLPVPKN